AADAMLSNDLALGRQLRSGRNGAHQDALTEISHQIGGQAVLAALVRQRSDGIHGVVL
nr:hypothetical protein [Tanacetum cinerariifolium]